MRAKRRKPLALKLGSEKIATSGASKAVRINYRGKQRSNPNTHTNKKRFALRNRSDQDRRDEREEAPKK